MREPVRTAARYSRRLLRKPHQKAFSGIGLLPDSPDSLYVDVGANNGQSIESIRLFKPHNPIISFEINPLLAARLDGRYPDITVHPFGLGNANGELTLHIPAYGTVFFDAWASASGPEGPQRFLNQFLRTRKPGRVDAMKCPVRTLDSFKLEPFLVKVDVEGGERNVIEGALETIDRCRPILLIEHGHLVLDLLEPYGYELYRYADGRFFRGERGVPDSFLVPKSIKLNG